METENNSENPPQLKSLIVDLCVFFSIALIMTIFISEIIRYPSSKRYQVYKELLEQHTHSNIVFFGSSITMTGINATYLDDKTKGNIFYNFSTGGSGAVFYDSWYKFIFRRFYPKPDIVFLEVGNDSFLEVMSHPFDDDIRYAPRKILWDILTNHDFPLNYKAIIHKRINKTYLLNSIFFDDGYWKQLMGKTEIDPNKGFDPAGNDRVQVKGVVDYLHSDHSAKVSKAFFSLVDQLHHENVKTVFIHFPEFVPFRIRDPHTTEIVENLAKSNHTAFLDYNNPEKLTDFNYDWKTTQEWRHLSTYGSSLFNKRLKEDIAPILDEFMNLKTKASLARDAKSLSLLPWQECAEYGKRAKQDGDFETARLYFTEALKKAEQFNNKDSRLTVSLTAFAGILSPQSEYKQKKELLLRALSIAENTNDEDHYLAEAFINLAGLYAEENNFVEAEKLFKRGLLISERIAAPDNLDFAAAKEELAKLLTSQNKHREAEFLLKSAYSIRLKLQGTFYPEVHSTRRKLINLYINTERYDDASALMSWEELDMIGESLTNKKEYDKALKILLLALIKAEELDKIADKFNSTHTHLFLAYKNLGTVYNFLGNYEKAESMFNRASTLIENDYKHQSHPDLLAFRNYVIRLHQENIKKLTKPVEP